MPLSKAFYSDKEYYWLVILILKGLFTQKVWSYDLTNVATTTFHNII